VAAAWLLLVVAPGTLLEADPVVRGPATVVLVTSVPITVLVLPFKSLVVYVLCSTDTVDFCAIVVVVITAVGAVITETVAVAVAVTVAGCTTLVAATWASRRACELIGAPKS